MKTTVLDALKSVNAYPIPLRTLADTAESRGLDLSGEATGKILRSKELRLAKADLLTWLSMAPNVSQGGQSYSFTDEQRKELRNHARSVYAELEPTTTAGMGVTYGYKGDRL